VAIVRPEKMPEDLDALDEWLVKAYNRGKEDGRDKLWEQIKAFLLKEFLYSKGRNRRADMENPRTFATNEVMRKLYAAYEDGSL
jgi:hypothetical protein